MDTLFNLRNVLFPEAEKHLDLIRKIDPLKGLTQFQGGYGPVYLKAPPGPVDENEMLHVVVPYGTNYHQYKREQERYTWYGDIIEDPYADDQMREALNDLMLSFGRDRSGFIERGLASSNAYPYERYITVIFNRCPFITKVMWTKLRADDKKVLLSYSAHLSDLVKVLLPSADLWVGHGLVDGLGYFDELLASMPPLPWIKTSNLSRLGRR